MFQSLKERSEVAVYRQVAALIALVMNFALTPLIIAFLTGRFGTFSGWVLTGVIIACISGGAYITSLFGSRERKEFSMAGTLPIKTAFKVALKNKSFITAVVCILMTSWIWSLTSAMSTFWIVYVLGGTIADMAIISTPVLFMTMLFYPFWRKICIHHGTKKTLTISTFLSVLFLLPFWLIADTVLIGAVMMFFYGFALSGVTLAREILIPDVIDEDEVKTGFRREGTYYGVGTFFDRFALALTGASTTLIFTLTRVVPGVPQPPQVILGMRLATSMILILALTVFLVSIKYYPLDAKKVIKIRKSLERIRKEREYHQSV